MTFSSTTVNLENIWSYLPTSTPHLIALFCVQYPFILSNRQIFENDFSYYPISKEMFENDFIFSINNWKKKRYHTLFAYSFIHFNQDHFWNNFLSIAFAGTHVIQQTGPGLFWITYVFGSIAGALSIVLEHKYHCQKSYFANATDLPSISNASNSNIVQSTLDALPTKSVANAWQKLKYNYGNKVIDNVFQFLNSEQGNIGCSSAVYSICALDFAITLDKILPMLKKMFAKYIMNRTEIHIEQPQKISFVFDCLSLYSGWRRILKEVEFLWFENKMKDGYTFGHLVVQSEDHIAHSAHVGGFIAGIGVYFVWKMCLKYRKYRSKKDGGSYSYRNSDGEKVYHVILKKNR